MSGRDNADSARAWRDYADGWRDVWTAPVVFAAMAVVSIGTLGTLTTGGEPTALAWMNGVAAVLASVAALAEARRGRSELNDHEVRLRMLERSPE